MNVRIAILLISFLLLTGCMNGQKTVKLWNGQPPTSNGLTGAEVVDRNGGWISNISDPEIIIHSPDESINNGMAVVICPGGGYGGLAIHHEGTQLAEWLNAQGITGIILKYRMPNGHKEVPLQDVRQAMKYVREHASELKINANKVGICGFSAGGHLAATASTMIAEPNLRPDFTILFYPVATLKVLTTHQGSANNLLGINRTDEEILEYSAEEHVTKDTPPAILFLSDDDTSVLPINSIKYYEALKQYNTPASMYIFPEGGHGWGMRDSFRFHSQMLDLLKEWLKDRNN